MTDVPLHRIAADLFQSIDLFPKEQRDAYIMGFIDGVMHESKKKQHIEVIVTTGPRPLSTPEPGATEPR